ncbi:Hypothetical predicted protein, partial [Pelobates cultripes]
ELETYTRIPHTPVQRSAPTCGLVTRAVREGRPLSRHLYTQLTHRSSHQSPTTANNPQLVAKMAAAGHAPEPPTTQPLQMQLASEHPHENRIASAFDQFWARLWAKMAQTPTAKTVPRKAITSPTYTSAPQSNTETLTGMKQERGGRAKPRHTSRGPHIRHRQLGSRHKWRTNSHDPRPLTIWRHTWRVRARPTASKTKTKLDTQRINHPKPCNATTNAQ